MANSKEDIEATLLPLMGEPFSDMMRYVGCQRFEFGIQRPAKNRKGKDITVTDLGAIVVSCKWRITQNGAKVVTSEDFGPKRERRDEDAKPFYKKLKTASPVVETIEANEQGSLRITFSEGFVLDVDTDAPEDRWPEYKEYRELLLADDERWRTVWADEEAVNIVVNNNGIEPI